MRAVEPKTIYQAIEAWRHALEQFERVCHYNDRQFMGRDWTASEEAEWNKRFNAERAAIRRACAFPCTTHAELRAKAKWMNDNKTWEHLEEHHFRAMLNSVLQMPRSAQVE